MTATLRILLAFIGLVPARALCDEVRLDAVGDVTDAGKNFARPTRDKPVYYFPQVLGYKEMGNYLIGEKPPPSPLEVEHLIAEALYQQGYRVMTKDSTPQLLLVFWWGYMAPQMVDASAASGVAGLGSFGGRPGGPMVAAMAAQEAGALGNNTDGEVTGGLGGVFTNQAQMLTLLAGEKYDELPQGSMSFKSPALRDEINHAALTPRYYVMVTAFDFQAALKKKRVKLWTARMSAAKAGTSLDKVLPALIAAGGPIFGRDAMPKFVQEPVDPMGHVIVGTPEVKDFPTAQGANKK